MQVSGTPQNFLVYQPRPAAETAPAHPLTSGLWQSQLRKLDGLLHEAPPAAKVQGAAAAPVVDLVAGRRGQVLREKTFLKADQYPGLHQRRLQDGRTRNPQLLLEGAPNYRELGENIHGTAMPTLDGARRVLEQAGRGPGQEGPPAVWTNLREEPVIYVNGRPHNLRHVKAPFHNQASPGRTAREVERLEQDLKADVLAEARRNGGKLVLHDEEAGPPARVVEREVAIESVQTPREVFEQLRAQGYGVEYQRLPVTDLKKPEDRDLDELVAALKRTDPGSPLIFNCHAGQGRTTTAMVIASLMRRAQSGEEGPLLKDQTLREDIKEQGRHQTRNYRGVLQAVKDSQRMLESQAKADQVIERYADTIDLKKSVKEAREEAATKGTASSRERAVDYLDRYHAIVAFEAYARDQAPDFKLSFTQWKRKHPTIEQNLERIQVALAHGSQAGTGLA